MGVTKHLLTGMILQVYICVPSGERSDIPPNAVGSSEKNGLQKLPAGRGYGTVVWFGSTGKVPTKNQLFFCCWIELRRNVWKLPAIYISEVKVKQLALWTCFLFGDFQKSCSMVWLLETSNVDIGGSSNKHFFSEKSTGDLWKTHFFFSDILHSTCFLIPETSCWWFRNPAITTWDV